MKEYKLKDYKSAEKISFSIDYDRELNLQQLEAVKLYEGPVLVIAGAGTGKTKTLQIIIEQLSAKGIPSLVMDIKGDLSGVAIAGESNPKIEERHANIGLPFTASGSPVEFLSLSNDAGARLRATVTEFGPVLFSKILELNDTQASVVSLLRIRAARNVHRLVPAQPGDCGIRQPSGSGEANRSATAPVLAYTRNNGSPAHRCRQNP